jgi:hypothetical protein
MVSVALCPPPPAMLNAQCPAATGVTANDVPLDGEIVAIPLHEFACPLAGVLAVNEPL